MNQSRMRLWWGKEKVNKEESEVEVYRIMDLA